jgi:hypothetical protein
MMKTCKDLSQEIMEKIQRKERARLRIKKCVRRVVSVAIIVGFLIPATLFSITDELGKYRPLSFPFEKKEPIDPEQQPENESRVDKDAPRAFELILPM